MKKYWFAILLLALLVRLTAAVYWEKRLGTAQKNEAAANNENNGIKKSAEDGPFFFGDSDSYWKLGRTIARGEPYRFDPERNWTVFRMPGYPALLAPLFWLGGENPPVFWGRIENVLFGVLTVLLTGGLGWTIFRDERVGLIAAALAAIDPSLTIQSVLILSEEPFTVALLLELFLLTAIFRTVGPDEIPAPPAEKKSAERSERLFMLGGALGGLSAAAVYLRPSWLWFVPFAFILAALETLLRRRARRIDVRSAILLLMIGFLAFSFCMSPWWIRNRQITGRFIATTLQSGASLYDGLSPTADGSSEMSFVDKFRAEVAADSTGDPTKREHFEVRLDERMKRASLDWAKTHPAEVVRLAWVKFVRLWNIFPNESSLSSTPVRLALLFSSGLIFLFALVGAVRSFRDGFAARLLLIPAIYITILHTIFVSSIRYRIPITPPLMILAAWGIVGVFRAYSKSRFLAKA